MYIAAPRFSFKSRAPQSAATIVRLFAFAVLVLPGVSDLRAQSQPASRPTTAPVIAPEQRTAAERVANRLRDASTQIIASVLAGNDGYTKLEHLCDDVGNRLSGSPGMERAIEWATKTLAADGQENVRRQTVMVPRWVRGSESIEMLTPRSEMLPMLGLGGSVGTPTEGITAPVISVSGQEELGELGDKVAGKIVLFDVPMPESDPELGSGYGVAVRYRGAGARYAVQYGAVAALVRSVTTHSLRSPHTGAMGYLDAIKKIPAAAITVEDAARITRLQKRGIEVTLRLKMDARTEPDVPGANVMGELRGREKPEEIVVIGGHLDSWDVGQGAHDDGGGCVMALEALHMLRKLDLRPRRTIRVVLFANEENGLAGGNKYAAEFAGDLKNHVAGIEADSGTFRPMGFSVDFEDAGKQALAAAQVEALQTNLAQLGALKTRSGFSGADVGPMRASGVPLLGLNVDQTRYFDYHHTQADTFDKVAKADLDQCVAAMAAMAYMLAEMPGRLGEEW